MSNLVAVIMLSVSTALGLCIFCAAGFALLSTRWARKWLMDLTMKWTNDVIKTMKFDDDEEEEP